MNVFNSADFVDVIDVTLFKYNHYDNLIFTKCLNQLDYLRVDDDSILVTPDQLQALFELNFEKDLRRINAITFELIHKDASSLFFLNKILEDFYRLKWVKLTLSKRRNFSRLVEDFEKTSRQIKYSYRVVHSTIRLNELMDVDTILKLNSRFEGVGLLDKKTPYSRRKLKTIIYGLESIMHNADIDEEEAEAISLLFDVIDSKLEGDNPDVLLVTEW